MRILAGLLLVLFSVAAAAQNLVPNPSFEAYNGCPTNFTSIDYSPTYSSFPTVKSWVRAIDYGTPDYFNPCGTAQLACPNTFMGYRQPHSGHSFVGGYTGATSSSLVIITNMQEYVECKLTQPLQAGHQYRLQFYCAAAQGPVLSNMIGNDKIGALISDSMISLSSSFFNITATPTVASPPGIAITDTLNWTLVKGTYIATGGEQWLTLGRFHDSIYFTGTIIKQNNTGSASYLSYYFFDDAGIWDFDRPDVSHRVDTSFCSTSVTDTLSGRPGAGEYYWSTGDTTRKLLISGAGTWWVRSWKDSMYYVDTFHVTLANPQVLHLPNDTAVCSGSPITISPNHAYNSYQWSTGSTSPTIVVWQSGQYIVTVHDVCGTQKDTVNVFYTQKLLLPSDTTTCNGQAVALSTNHSYHNYLWNTGSSLPVITVTQTGQYILSVTDSCGIQQDTTNVIIHPTVPLPIANDTTICKGIINPLINVKGDSLRWYLSTGGASTLSQAPFNTSSIGTQTIYVTQTKNGCESGKKGINIQVIDKPSFDLGADTTLCNGIGLIVGPYDPNINWHWSNGANYSPLVIRQSGYYLLTGTNKCGTLSDNIAVTFTDCDSSSNPTNGNLNRECITTVTAFTPNNDGKNDKFKVFSRCPLSEYHIRIYNRWGRMIYQGDDINESWDGTVVRQPVEGGTYYFYIDYLVANSGNVHDRVKGEVTVIR